MTDKLLYLWDSEDYREVLKEALKRKGRGSQSALAQALQVQAPYMTRVLNGDAHLSPEQALLAAISLKYSSLETEYFLCLVNYGRAGTIELRAHLAAKLEELRQKGKPSLEDRLGNKEHGLDQAAVNLYYSHWIYTALHMLTSIPEPQTVASICERINLPPNVVEPALGQLVDWRLVEQNGSTYKMLENKMFIQFKTQFINRFHSSWRMKLLQDLEYPPDASARHITLLVGMAESSLPKLREVIERASREVADIVEKDAVETNQVICFDFFPLSRKQLSL
jgi:uncharacterized protein (TIGR02147 family)